MAGTSSSDPIFIEDNDDLFHILQYDDFYFSSQNDENFPMSNDNFAHELHLQQVLLSSLSSSSLPSSSSSSSLPSSSSSKSKSKSKILCEICMDTKPMSQMFRNRNICAHLFCKDCIRGHVAAKINENINKVKCPHLQCKELIGPENCRSVIPKDVIERWENSLCESVILASEKITYCPFKDCSAMLVDDSGEKVTSSVCPNGNRLFCASCKVGWHSGLDCKEFRRGKKRKKDTDEDDSELMDLAKKKKWKRCPNCKFFVEKRSGCLHITCRCGYSFCYKCGEKFSGSHYNCE